MIYFLIYLFCFLSGACGLIHETILVKIFTRFIGSTIYSITIVVSVFMGGLALGAYYFAKIGAKSKNPLKIYGILEILIGIYSVILPFFLPLFTLFNKSIYSFSKFYFTFCKFTESIILIFPLSFFMGGTIPVLVKYFDSAFNNKTGKQAGIIYGLNTLGACIGAGISGFILLPYLGILNTRILAATLNVIIGLLSVYMTTTKPKIKTTKFKISSVKEANLNFNLKSVIIIFAAVFISGFSGMVLQVLYTRGLILSIGSSTYAFSLILTGYILGTGLGSFIFAWILKFVQDKLSFVGWLLILSGVAAILSYLMIAKLPVYIVEVIIKYGTNMKILFLVEFLYILCVVVFTTFFMGGIYPFATALLAEKEKSSALSSGYIYAFNTIGCVLGTLICGFFLINLWGVELPFKLIIILLLLTGLLILIYTRKLVFIIIGFLIFISGVLANQSLKWNIEVMNSGVFLYAKDCMLTAKASDISVEAVLKNEKYATGKIIFFKQGAQATVGVKRGSKNHLTLLINGKADAGTGSDMRTQVLSGLLPVLLHKKPDTLCMIGLGSGISAGAVLTYPEIKFDVIEISKTVIEAVRKFFNPFANNVLDSKRVNLVIEDGRLFLLLTNKKYDIISAEPSNPWVKGMGELFTKEYFELCKKRLKKDGIFCQWLHAYKMSPYGFKCIVKTFLSVFPDSYLFECIAGVDYLLIALPDFNLDFSFVVSKLKKYPFIKNQLKKVDVPDAAHLLTTFVMGHKNLKAFSKNADIITDNNCLLEFITPFTILTNTVPKNLREIEKYREPPESYIKNIPASVKQKFLKISSALREYRKLKIKEIIITPQKLKKIENILTELSELKFIREYFSKVYFKHGMFFLGKKEIKKAEFYFKKAVNLNPNFKEALFNLGGIYAMTGRLQKAITLWEKVLIIDPYDIETKEYLKKAYSAIRK